MFQRPSISKRNFKMSSTTWDSSAHEDFGPYFLQHRPKFQNVKCSTAKRDDLNTIVSKGNPATININTTATANWTNPLSFRTLILVTLLSYVKLTDSSLTIPSSSVGGAGIVIDMDSYPQLHPHRHSRLNNLIIKALNNNHNAESDSNINNNVYYESISDSSELMRSNSHQPSSKLNPALPLQVLYANGATESTLPECGPMSVCNKIETYESPWVEKQCRCKHGASCSTSLSLSDPYSLYDKTRQYKLCEPVRELKKCRYFRDVTWTITTKGDNITSQIVHCKCPKDSVAYLIKRGVYRSLEDSTSSGEGAAAGFKYSFACSPISRGLCQRKEPCRLFTLKRRSNHSVNDINSSTLCQCPKGFTCPAHHLDAGVIRGKLYPENSLRTYSGYCV